jgi:hypothetical protein
MFINIRYPCDITNAPDSLVALYGMIPMFITIVISYFNDQVNHCRERIFSLSSTNITSNSSFLKCNIPYDECRCSIISNKSTEAIECVTDIQIIAAHILPLVSYVWQLYIIYKLFSFTGRYSHILRHISWAIALFVFIIIAIGTRGNTCLYYNTSDTLILSCIFVFAINFVLFAYNDTKYRARADDETCQKKRFMENNHKCKNLTIIIVVR